MFFKTANHQPSPTESVQSIDMNVYQKFNLFFMTSLGILKEHLPQNTSIDSVITKASFATMMSEEICLVELYKFIVENDIEMFKRKIMIHDQSLFIDKENYKYTYAQKDIVVSLFDIFKEFWNMAKSDHNKEQFIWDFFKILIQAIDDYIVLKNM
jgi:hypothetical protein